MNIFITGSTGYVGQSVVAEARRQGHSVIEASRRKPENADRWVQYELDSDDPVSFKEEIDAVIHLAVNTENPVDDGGELLACKKIHEFARAKNSRFIFVSSQAANENAPTPYGRIKWKIEQSVLDQGGYVVRLGQVYGGPEKGLFGVLASAVRKLPLVPAFLPSPMIQPIHVDDCGRGLLKIASTQPLTPKIYNLAEDESVRFTHFMKSIATHRLGVSRFFIPVPTFLITILSVILGRRLSDRFGLSRLRSLFALKRMSTKDDLAILDLKLRKMSNGMQADAERRRRLIKEGRTFLTYILRRKPPSSLVRRYVKAIEQQRDGFAMGFPAWATQFPGALSLFNEAPKYPEFVWRLNAATLIVEASPVGGTRFIGNTSKAMKIGVILKMGYSVVSHVIWKVLGFLLSPAINTRFYMRNF